MESLPTEMVRAIAGFLPAESQAALALTSRRLLYQLGSGTLKLEGVEPWFKDQCRFRLLLLLARDPRLYPDLIPCRVCLCFHAPGDVFAPVSREATATTSSQHDCACVREYRKSLSLSRVSTPFFKWVVLWLECNVHVNAVAGIMRSHRVGHNLYTPNMLSRNDTRSNRFGDILHRESTYRIIKIDAEWHLVEKIEWLLLPNITKQILPISHFALGMRQYSCSHRRWTDVGCPLDLKHEACLWSPHPLPCYKCRFPDTWHQYTCQDCGLQSMDNKPPSCDEATSLPMLSPDTLCQSQAQPEKRPSQFLLFRTATSQARIGYIESCQECYTDTTFSIVEDLGPGKRVLALTCWRDLGPEERPETDKSAILFGHPWAVQPRSPTCASERTRGNIFEAFERETGNYRATRDRWQALPSKDALQLLCKEKQAYDARAN